MRKLIIIGAALIALSGAAAYAVNKPDTEVESREAVQRVESARDEKPEEAVSSAETVVKEPIEEAPKSVESQVELATKVAAEESVKEPTKEEKAITKIREAVWEQDIVEDVIRCYLNDEDVRYRIDASLAADSFQTIHTFKSLIRQAGINPYTLEKFPYTEGIGYCA